MKRVLVVDDEPGIGRVLCIKLKLSGYECLTTTSGAKAIEMIREQQPDLVLLDIFMPDVTGIDVLKNVRTFTKIPIVVFTAMSEAVPMALQAGATDSISKPFHPDQVVKKIEAVLACCDQNT